MQWDTALARYTAADCIAIVTRHRIRFHEKHKRQLFCDESSELIIEMLVPESGLKARRAAGRATIVRGPRRRRENPARGT